jgi:hypothetical protein
LDSGDDSLVEAGFVTELIDQGLAGCKDQLLAVDGDLEERSWGD